jgi:predicted small secreted protein
MEAECLIAIMVGAADYNSITNCIYPKTVLYSCNTIRRILMNKKIIFLAMPVLILALGMVLIGCGTTSAAGSKKSGSQLKVTISGIPQEYNGKLGWIQLDTGSSRSDKSVAWAMGNVSNGSITFNILDWVTNKSYNKPGNYFVTFFVWKDIDAARAKGTEPLWQGIIMSKDIRETTSITLSEFTKM